MELSKKETMSSLELARVTGKPHNDMLKSIRRMEKAWEKVNGGNFSLVDYTDKKGEKRVMYDLTKTESLYVATKFNDEARAKVILRWEELESSKAVVPYSDDPFIALRINQIEQDHKLAEHEQAIKVLEAKTTTRVECFTIAGYASLKDLPMPLKLASSLGRKATNLCKLKGIEPDVIPDPRFGKVKMYPKTILDEIFETSLV